jgi:predicted dehydrogenase
MSSTRREFLQQAAVAGAAAAVPYVWTSRLARAQDVNSKRTVAAIGVGGSRGAYSQGGSIARRAARLAQMVAVCDVDDLHAGEFNERMGGKLKTYRDYRLLLEKEKPDIVTIGTPDHWHVPIAIAALRAGCDVYCEKPLTLTIGEGSEIGKVVKETGKVFQVGTQQRSEDEFRFLDAINLVRSGRLGKNVKAYVAIGPAPAGGPFEPTPPPSDLDWDMWVGPAQKAEFCDGRRKDFRWWFDYSGGKMTDWGAHHIDISQWALGCDHTGPVKVRGTGKFPPIIPGKVDWAAYLNGDAALPNGFNTAMEFSIDLEFANGAVINVNHEYDRKDGRTKFDNGILFEGDEGRIFVNRGKLEGKPVQDLTDADRQQLDEQRIALYKGKLPGSHMRNFFECVEDRSEPISDVYTHHRTMTSCHLCNIALMLGRELSWDPEKEQFPGDDQANALISRKRREGFGAS